MILRGRLTTAWVSQLGRLNLTSVIREEANNAVSIEYRCDRRYISDALQATITALYCKILVILGLAFPMAEVISDNVPKGYYQLFYVYLFLGSLLFLLFVYVDLLRTKAKVAVDKKLAKNRSLSENLGDEESLIPRPRVHYGSFYLRLGAMLFGGGSMIYSGIEIGMFFELSLDVAEQCKNLFSVIRPSLQMVFVFVQMYFIFLNQKMNIYKHKFLSRFGLMHMIASNLCVWLNVLILETSHEIVGLNHNHDASDVKMHNDTVRLHHQHLTIPDEEVDGQQHSTSDLSASDFFDLSHLTSQCSRKDNIMSKLLNDSAPFLFPCTIEYSLICAAILFVIWKNVAEEHEHYKFQSRRIKIAKNMKIEQKNSGKVEEGSHHGDDPLSNSRRSPHHYTVDCTRANTGLFVGIFVMVLTIISVIVFFVLILSSDQKLHGAAITLASLTELCLYSMTTLAVLVGMMQIRNLWYDQSRKLELDNLLLVVSQTGVFIYSAFCIIGSFFQLHSHLLPFLASLSTLVQTTLQTLFILDASSRFAYTTNQVKKKPGREVVTFLLVCNLAMWAINTLETNRADSHPIQAKFYGGEWAWPIITHVSMPLAIFYRFHSTVCLCEIWKRTFKYKSSNLAYV